LTDTAVLASKESIMLEKDADQTILWEELLFGQFIVLT
jgi:hypothetical protein